MGNSCSKRREMTIWNVLLNYLRFHKNWHVFDFCNNLFSWEWNSVCFDANQINVRRQNIVILNTQQYWSFRVMLNLALSDETQVTLAGAWHTISSNIPLVINSKFALNLRLFFEKCSRVSFPSILNGLAMISIKVYFKWVFLCVCTSWISQNDRW